jgi:FtsP/CotA-like multicopper oxidase with cupredoxin domain
MRYPIRIVLAIAFCLVFSVAAVAQGDFANPPEIVHQNGHLKAVIQLSDAKRAVPNGSSQTQLRMFQGWPLDDPNAKPAPDAAQVAPGPTLRARVGGRVDVMFLNKVDDSHFAYTTDSAGSPGWTDCDHRGQYPPPTPNPPDPYATEIFPDCFHGSSTSNLHFHGTHTSPDGLGDNVLVQVLPNKDVRQSDWQADFDTIYNAPRPPQHWSEMPRHYQTAQLGYTAEEMMAASHSGKTLAPKGLVGDYDAAQAAKAKASGRPAPESLWNADFHQVVLGRWPQYVVGAFPNALELPDYKGGSAGLRAEQAPGTHWYHAHKHGSTSLHIFNGLAGALIVEGDYDDKLRAFFNKQLPASMKLVEQVMVFQQIVPSQNLEKVGGDNPQSGNNQKLINGKINPTIHMMPGEIQLWRLINAMGGGGKGTLDFTLFQAMLAAGFQIRQVAYDGVQFSWENYLLQPFFLSAGVGTVPSGIPFKYAPPGLTLAAGNRADLLIMAPKTAGISRFQISGDLHAANLTANPPVPLGSPFLVLTVNVAGPAQTMHFFSKNDKSEYPVMPAFLEDLAPPPATNVRTLTFSSTAGPGGPPTPPQFTIDNHRFALNPDGTPVSPDSNVDQCQQVNSTWDWTLQNTSKAPNQVHPFHIHINPFQILEIKYTDAYGNPATYTPPPGGSPIWADVVAIPVNGSVKIRQAFNDFTGTYVLHCHILAHEDRGMMQLVRTIPENADPATACKLNGIEHH